MFTGRKRDFHNEEVLISVAVQELIFSRSSGVMFTIEPVSGAKDKIVINASWGLGEAVVSGQVTPDEYLIDKKDTEYPRKTYCEKGEADCI